VSDAGTPLISDPGYRVVRHCLKANITVSPVPGPAALIAGLCVAGLPTDAFRFVGFPPSRKAARERWLESYRNDPNTLVLYESPHRIVACLQSLQAVIGGQREMTLARELTKQFETVLHGSIDEVLERVVADANQQRGEFVVMVAGNSAVETGISLELDRLIAVLNEHLPPKKVARCAADLLSISKQDAYRRVMELKSAN